MTWRESLGLDMVQSVRLSIANETDTSERNNVSHFWMSIIIGLNQILSEKNNK